MSWAEIKRAVNSSLGTSDFEPLDMLFKKTADDLYYNFAVLLNKGVPNNTILAVPKTKKILAQEYYQKNYTVAILPDGIEIIGDRAFSNTPIDHINIPETVTEFGSEAFAYTGNLTGFHIPSGVAQLSNGLFRGSDIRILDIPNQITSINDNLCKNCTYLTSVTLPNNITRIGDYAFYACENLISIEIPSSVTSIGSYAFEGCSSLPSVEIPDGVTSIGKRAFYNCSSLTTIRIPNSVQSVGEYAFGDCSGLKEIIFESGITTVPEKMFEEVGAVDRLVLPVSITSIGNYAFRNLYNVGVKNIYYEGSEQQWAQISIGEHNSGLDGATIHYNYVGD